MRLLSAEALVALLERRLVVLTGGPRDQPERLQTMRQAIAWSYGLLSPREQALFRRLSVFAGGFDMEAAAAVVGSVGEDSSTPFILDDIAALADQSLLVRSRSIGSRATPIARFGMLETLREYGLERLTESREAESHEGAPCRLVRGAGRMRRTGSLWGRGRARWSGPPRGRP